MLRSSRWALRVCTTLMFLLAKSAVAQWQSNVGPAGAGLGAVTGGDVERYLRALEITGRIAPLSWAARPFNALALSAVLNDSLTKRHPWGDRMKKALTPRASLAGAAFMGKNSGFPWGSNDGAMWQGRGVNAAIGVAAAFHWGRFSAVAAPIAFIAQNTAFPLMATPSNVSSFADALFPQNLDMPQRYGSTTYSRVDGGESSISMRGLGIMAGVSTASIGWGPGESFPAILGPNAGGFPHFVVGTTGRGLQLRSIGRFTAQYIFGVLDQTAYSPVQGSESFVGGRASGTKRIGVGMTASFMPAFLPTLELGASRFYHSPYRSGSEFWSPWSKPLEGIFKNSFSGRPSPSNDQNGDVDNQLASAFVRWSFPGRGGEVSFEYFREDHSWDSRDLAAEPESNAAVIASIRAATHRSARELALLTFEYFDGDIPPIAQVRGVGGLYIHGTLSQGHTQRGQLLGTPVGAGAMTGQSVSWERFRADGSIRVNLRRWRPRSRGSTDRQGLYINVEAPIDNYHDWIIDGSIGVTRFRGASAVSLEAGVAYAGRWQLADSRTNFYLRTGLSLF